MKVAESSSMGRVTWTRDIGSRQPWLLQCCGWRKNEQSGREKRNETYKTIPTSPAINHYLHLYFIHSCSIISPFPWGLVCRRIIIHYRVLPPRKSSTTGQTTVKRKMYFMLWWIKEITGYFWRYDGQTNSLGRLLRVERLRISVGETWTATTGKTTGGFWSGP